MRENDEFDEFVRGRTHALLRSAFLLTGDQHLAEDLVQASLARTHRVWARLEHIGNAESYTRRVMYHLQVSWWRRRRVPEWVTDVPPEPRGGYDGTGSADVRIVVGAALLRLSAKQRAVLVLRFFEDRTAEEAADLLGVSVGTVKSQTSRALARLRVIAPELTSLQLEDRSI
jgi:RNA polymerase sigma-70 factor (sigma-E family)